MPLAALTAEPFRRSLDFSSEAKCQVLFWGHHLGEKWPSCGNQERTRPQLKSLLGRLTAPVIFPRCSCHGAEVQSHLSGSELWSPYRSWAAAAGSCRNAVTTGCQGAPHGLAGEGERSPWPLSAGDEAAWAV